MGWVSTSAILVPAGIVTMALLISACVCPDCGSGFCGAFPCSCAEHNKAADIANTAACAHLLVFKLKRFETEQETRTTERRYDTWHLHLESFDVALSIASGSRSENPLSTDWTRWADGKVSTWVVKVCKRK
jgi:hypothetical protein